MTAATQTHAGADESAHGASERAFTARRVPDFARLHAVEEARVARWKRQNKKTVTVPLAFRLALDPNKVNNAATSGQPAATGGTSSQAPYSAQGSSRGEGTDPGSARDRSEGAGGKACEADDYASQHKENEAVQSNRVGAPSDQVLYPAAFNRNTRSGKRDSRTSASSRIGSDAVADRPISSGFALRPLSTRDMPSTQTSACPAQQQRRQQQAEEPDRSRDVGQGSAHRDMPSTQTSACPAQQQRRQQQAEEPDRSRDVGQGSAHAHRDLPSSTAVTEGASTMDNKRDVTAAGVSAPVQPHSGRRPSTDRHRQTADQDLERAGRDGEDSTKAPRSSVAPTQAGQNAEQGPHSGARLGPSSTGSNLSAIVAHEGNSMKTDPAQLRSMLEKLPTDSPFQPFSSLEFYHFGKTLGEGAYGKVKLGTHLLTHEKVAVKTFEKSKLTEPHANKRVAREIRIIKALDHPHIIKLYEVVDTARCKYLIMQFSSGGDLCR